MPHSLNNQFESLSTFVTGKENQGEKTIEETVSLTVNSSITNDESNTIDFRPLQPQQVIGDCYRVIKLLNSDPLFMSYLVRDKQDKHDSLLVLEFVGALDTASQTFNKHAFLQKVALIKKLSSHVQIPKLISHGVEDEQYYLVYEYTEGKILNSILEYRPFTELEIVNCVQDVARIYDFLIRGNIIDFKISFCNILKSRANNRYVLGNFKDIFSDIQPTISFLTTKQQQDIFQQKIQGLGITIIQSLLGEYAKNGSLKLEISANWRRQVSLSPQLQAILARMIATNNSDRYESFQELVDDLKPLVRIQQIVGNKYRLIRYLGENSGIKTYLARNVTNQKSNSPLLIVKQFVIEERDRNFTEAKVSNLEQEVQKIKRLQIFKTSDLVKEKFEDCQELYFVRDYIEGVSLGKQINQKTLFDPQTIIVLLKDILQNLELVHQQQLIHRNLKATNIILAKENQTVTLVDFGILQAIGKNNNEEKKNEQNLQPPEQIVGRPTISSDIYSLGIIIIEALTKSSPKDWQDRLIDYPLLITIIEKMIRLDVDRRYQSTLEVQEDLKKVKQVNGKSINIDKKALYKQNKTKKILLAITGVFCLLGALEIAFPLIRPQYHVYQGRKNLFQQPKTALINFEKAIKLQEKQAAAWLGKGSALLNLQEFDLALKAYDKAAEINPNSMIAWQGKGNVFYQLENYNKALENYDKALLIKPQDAVSLAKRAKALYSLSRYQEALSLQEKALNIQSSTNAWLFKDFANTSLALRRYNQALSVLTRVENIAPLKPYLWHNKVIALQNLNRSIEALNTTKLVLESYSDALEKEPNDLNLWLGKAEFLTQLKRYSQALETYQTAIAISPNSHAAWLGKSKTLLIMKQYQQALEAVEKALDIQPQSFTAWHTKGLILQQGLDRQEAIESFDKAIAINQDFFPSWRDRGILLASQNNYSQGIESLRKAVALAPQDISSWLYLSDTLQSMQKTEEALTAIDQAIYLQPRNSNHWLTKGSLREKQQEYTEACNIYRQATKIAPDWKITEAMERVGCDPS